MAATTDLQDILVRIERLERLQARSRECVDVETLVVRDRDGTPRALLRVEDGSPRLRLADAGMRTRIVLGIGDDGAPFLEFTDEKGVTRARLATQRDGSPTLRLFGSDGTTSAGLVVLADGSRRMALFGRNGNASVTFAHDDAGVGVALHDDGGTPRAEVRVSGEGKVRIRLADADGTPLARPAAG